MKSSRHLVWLLVGLMAAVGFAADTNSPVRPPDWAQPVAVPGIKNFHRVNATLYRGAQPTAEGMKQLKAMGIKTVVNLREFHPDKDLIAGTGLKSVYIPMEPWHGNEQKVIRFLQTVTDTNNQPVFVHCERGADRTGLMCAMYRVVVCGWTKEAAIREMRDGGFGFNPVWHELVTFIEKADVADIKRRAGLPEK